MNFSGVGSTSRPLRQYLPTFPRGSGSPHLLRRGDKGRSGTVLSGLLDPSKTRAGSILTRMFAKTKRHRLRDAFEQNMKLKLT
jgi:hypothetical protein